MEGVDWSVREANLLGIPRPLQLVVAYESQINNNLYSAGLAVTFKH